MFYINEYTSFKMTVSDKNMNIKLYFACMYSYLYQTFKKNKY